MKRRESRFMRMQEIDDITQLLDWYAHAGVDYILADEPIDRFEESRLELAERRARVAGPRQTPPAPSPVERTARVASREAVRLPATSARFEPAAQPVARPQPGAKIPSGDEVMAARTAAASATSLHELKTILAEFHGCNLRQTAKSLVFADGNPTGRVMVVGEAPGREEDEAGVPFVGRSGQLLDLMLAAIGLDRTSVYIANVVPWRPPGNRTPTPQETEICKPFILRQIALARPEIVVLLGGAAASALVGTSEGILKLRGRWLEVDAGDIKIPALATLHPAYLLRQPLQKRLAWRDLRDLKRRLDGAPPPGTDA